MRLHRWLPLLAALWLGLSLPAMAQDLRETLQNVPEGALGFVVTNRLDQVNDKFHSLAKKLQLPLPGSPLETIKGALGVSKGLNVKGCAAVALVAVDNGMPTPIFLLPVSDYQDFVGQFKPKDVATITELALPDGTTVVVAKKGKHAALVHSEQREALKKYLAGTANLAAWSAPLQSWLEENDLAVVVTPQGIKTALEPMRMGLGMAKNAGGKEEVQFLLNRWIDALNDFLKTVETDVTHLAIGSKLDKPGNLHVDTRAVFAKGGALGKGAAGMKVDKGGPLAGLPGGPYAMAFGGSISESLMKDMMGISLEVMKMTSKAAGEEVPEAKAKQLEKAFSEATRGIRGMSMVLRNGKEGETLLGNMVATMKVDDAAAYLDRYEKNIAALNDLYKGLNNPFFPSMTVKKMTVDKAAVLEIVTTMPANKAQADPLQQKIMESMFGPGGKMTACLAAADSTTVIMTYRPAEAMKEALKTFGNQKARLTSEPDVATTLSMLPEGSQWVYLIDPNGMTTMIGQWIKAFVPAAPVQIPIFPRTPPVGMAVKLAETGLIFHIAVPVQVLENIHALMPKGQGVASR